jgi:inorganic pyrophosphatase
MAKSTRARSKGAPGNVRVIIDTPKGSHNKYKYDEGEKLFRLEKVLPAGMVFPYDFGYVPGTRAGDGDPLDVMVLMDEAAFVGCLVEARLIGVIEAEQKEPGGEAQTNDRLIGVAARSHDHEHLSDLTQVSPRLLDEIEGFFVSYNRQLGKRFTPRGRHGAARAWKILEDSTSGHHR